MMMVKIYERT